MRFARTPPITLLTRLTQLIESPCALNFRQSSFWLAGCVGGGRESERSIATILSAAAPTCLLPVQSLASNMLRAAATCCVCFVSFTFLLSLATQRVANGTSRRRGAAVRALKIAGKLSIRFILLVYVFVRRTCAK